MIWCEHNTSQTMIKFIIFVFTIVLSIWVVSVLKGWPSHLSFRYLNFCFSLQKTKLDLVYCENFEQQLNISNWVLLHYYFGSPSDKKLKSTKAYVSHIESYSLFNVSCGNTAQILVAWRSIVFFFFACFSLIISQRET